MIYALTVTNFLGDRIRLELGKPEQTGFLIRSISGLGPVKANVNTTEIVTNDGSLFNSARLSERNIVLDMVFVHSVHGEGIVGIRQKSYKYFPIKKKVELVFETDSRCVRTVGYVESNEPDIFSSQEGTQISILCPDPYFYSANAEDNMVTDFYSVEPLFQFPFSNESLTTPLIALSDIHTQTEGVIVYTGDSEIGVVIRMHVTGPAERITIYNLKTRESMVIDTAKLEAMTGQGLTASDDIIVNTQKGEKGIVLLRSGVRYNILNCLDKNTDWFTLVKGDNLFAFTADSGVANIQFRVENKVIYEGV